MIKNFFLSENATLLLLLLLLLFPCFANNINNSNKARNQISFKKWNGRKRVRISHFLFFFYFVFYIFSILIYCSYLKWVKRFVAFFFLLPRKQMLIIIGAANHCVEKWLLWNLWVNVKKIRIHDVNKQTMTHYISNLFRLTA